MDNEKTLSALTGQETGSMNSAEDMTRMAEDVVDSFFAGMTKIGPSTEEYRNSKSGTTVTEITPTTSDSMDAFTPITAQDASREANAKIMEQIKQNDADILKVFDKAADDEDARLAHLEAVGTAAYDDITKKPNDTVAVARSVDQDELRRSSGDPDYAMISDADFTPSFDEYDEDEVNASTKTEEPAENYDTPEDVTNILANSPTVEFTNSVASPIQIVKNRKMRTEIVSSGRLDSKVLADQAFINNANKFKSKNFRTVRVPLVNSGFSVDLVGTGANDLVMLYDDTDQHIGASEYELNCMKTIIRAVVGTEPRVDPNQLKNVIHHRDYEMMAYGHLCATLADVVFPYTCDKCNHTFKVKANTADLLLNAKELVPRIDAIKHSNNPAENSLMAADIKLTFESGFEVVIAHPSYYDEVVMLNALNHYITTLKPIEAIPLAKLATNLLYIKSITLPNGLRAANVYQTFKALRLMDLNENDQVIEAIKTLRKDVVEPKFGVANIECPHCHEILDEVTVDSVKQMVFFHIMVLQAEKETMRKQYESGTSK